MKDARTPNDPLALTLTREDWLMIQIALIHEGNTTASCALRQICHQINGKIQSLLRVGAPEEVP